MSQTIPPAPAQPTSVNEAESAIKSEEAKTVSFFETHPLATFISGAIIGAAVVVGFFHFL